MRTSAMSHPPLRIPRRLVTETRAALREIALRRLDELAARGAKALVLDLADVAEVDIGGIGILVLLQKRALERGMVTRLVNTPAQVERLLSLTQLDYLFEMAH